MTEHEKLKITELYALGNGYKKIGRLLGIPSDSVKSYIRRHGKDAAERLKTTCMQCGAPITQPQRKQLKKFCSDKCRLKWWGQHTDMLTHKSIYSYTCLGCGATFTTHRKEAKYCNRICYMKAHRKEKQ